ncbi:MAG: aminoacyl-tRNA hydrolase [Bacteroidetes bacterium]|nr:MAG: aminoacyl-tRNA hydrolase [Bacteroidota bacterium]RLD46477.1 MAG: aminoacyl-tRNA hydrolase [Bacteroidota bacterium]RLD72266.1 MAG: aminoacyl-tRNA hydrolase [Bacteroidota bacterium]RLD88456.1 MAG: aminoacyl-tRNA hydrolase [Bacteroidota bacterium]HHL57807.1 aminoacyl-tRNA hydrolase [Bacteroidota bacterium]
MKYLIAGLGNIGIEYANTRHNIGFVVADALCRELKGSFSVDRLASVCKVKYKGRTLVIIKPTTYMNLSGKSVKYWMEKEKIPVERTLVVLDDIALPPGMLRMKARGGDAGHNGLTDIILKLNTDVFPRLRIGIGNDFPKGYQSDYVLGQWTRAEEKLMIPQVEKAVETIKSFVTLGIDRTMTVYNNK